MDGVKRYRWTRQRWFRAVGAHRCELLKAAKVGSKRIGHSTNVRLFVGEFPYGGITWVVIMRAGRNQFTFGPLGGRWPMQPLICP